MDAIIIFPLCLFGTAALNVLQGYLAVRGFVIATDKNPVQRRRLSQPFFVLCASNLIQFIIGFVGLASVSNIADKLTHHHAVYFRGWAIQSFIMTLFICPFYGIVTARLSYTFRKELPQKAGEAQAILGQALSAIITGFWSIFILVRQIG